MKRFITDTTFWFRACAVAALLWIGIIIILSSVLDDFHWNAKAHWQGRGFIVGPASVTAGVGVALIIVVCFGVPWIAESMKHDDDG